MTALAGPSTPMRCSYKSRGLKPIYSPPRAPNAGICSPAMTIMREILKSPGRRSPTSSTLSAIWSATTRNSFKNSGNLRETVEARLRQLKRIIGIGHEHLETAMAAVRAAVPQRSTEAVREKLESFREAELDLH